MAANVIQDVDTNFKAKGAAAAAQQMGMLSRALGPLGGAMKGVTGLMSPLGAALGALAGGAALAGVASISSVFEDMQLSIAQTMKFMGQADTFPEAMKVAREEMDRIMAVSAALPGEAEDYARGLALSGAVTQRAVKDYEKSFKLIKDMTAIGISVGRSTEETAMQLNRALNVERGMLEIGSDYTQELVTAMKAIPGYADITNAKFNKMKLEERVEIMTKLTGIFADRVEAASNTWEAISGATQTTIKTMVVAAGAPLFESMKNSLRTVNDLLMDSEGRLTEQGRGWAFIGQLISTTVGKALEGMSTLMSRVGGQAVALITMLDRSPVVRFLDSVITGSGGMGQAFQVAGHMLSVVFNDLIAVAGVLWNLFTAWGNVLWGVIQIIWKHFRPGLEALANAAVGLYEGFVALIKAIGPLFGYLGEQLMHVYDVLYEHIAPVFNTLAKSVGTVIEYFGLLLKELAKWIGKTVEERRRTTGDQSELAAFGQVSRTRGPVQTMISSFFEDMEKARTKRRGTRVPGAFEDARSKTGTVQDFRYSRFDISQAFEKGFDPDRIAVAFADDLGKVGEQRLQSGLEPGFGR